MRFRLYLASVTTTALAVAVVVNFDSLPFVAKALCFAACAGWTAVRAGIGPGLLAVALATLATDYFLLDPIYEFTFDLSTAAAFASYSALAMTAVRCFPGGGRVSNSFEDHD